MTSKEQIDIISLSFMGMGQICTMTLLHKGSNMHKETLLHEIIFLHKDNFAQGVTFA